MRVTNVLKGIKVAEHLPNDYPMVSGVTAMPLETNQYEANKKAHDMIKRNPELVKQLLEELK